MIEDYAVIGDTMTAALVGRDGSIDWLCLPRFDSHACFARLLGDERHGRWLIAPVGTVRAVRRQYRPGTLVLETEFDTDEGTVRLVDAMPVRQEHADVVRLVEGVRGRVPMRMELVMRFDYGLTVPWVRRVPGGLFAVAGPDALLLDTAVPTTGERMTTTAEFTVGPDETVPFCLVWHPSHLPAPTPPDPVYAIEETTAWWRRWSGRSTYNGPYVDAVERSLITLKALTYAPTGGIVAAVTTSLPEDVGGVRNWDYRFCWLRDATLTLQSLLVAGYTDEAVAWRDWLLRAIAGSPAQMRTLYGAAGERFLPEMELPWLPGYENSRPVRIGNAASEQFQLDVYGEVLDALHEMRVARGETTTPDSHEWAMQRALLDYLEGHWREPDEGIWEVRGGRRHFTHSKVMAWVGFDRAVSTCETLLLDAPLDRWRAARDEVHAEICAQAWSAEKQSFGQSYGDSALDAALLQMPLVGFLPIDDPRVTGTIAAIERELCESGLVARYDSSSGVDGLPGDEGKFLACSFWLAQCFAGQGRRADATTLFERLLALRNDVGLLAEEYDTKLARQVGNFPQAFSHIGLVTAAAALG